MLDVFAKSLFSATGRATPDKRRVRSTTPPHKPWFQDLPRLRAPDQPFRRSDDRDD